MTALLEQEVERESLRVKEGNINSAWKGFITNHYRVGDIIDQIGLFAYGDEHILSVSPSLKGENITELEIITVSLNQNSNELFLSRYFLSPTSLHTKSTGIIIGDPRYDKLKSYVEKRSK